MKVYICMRYIVDGNNAARVGLIDSVYPTFESAVKHLENSGYSEIDDYTYKTETNCVWRSKIRFYDHLDGGYFCTIEPVYVEDSQ